MPDTLTTQPLAAAPIARAAHTRAIHGPQTAARAETLAFRLAMAAAALWVVDDAFWHREPGTAVGDHLMSGLVPVALAALLALAYPRLRPGVRAVAALTAGPLMVVAGIVDGVRHLAVDRLGGDDVTAIVAALAGAVLVVFGAVVLWRSRRLDERPLRRYLRRALVAALAVVAGLFVVMPVALAIVTNHKARAPVERVDLGQPYVDVTLTTSDGLRLAAWYVPSRNGAAIAANAPHAKPATLVPRILAPAMFSQPVLWSLRVFMPRQLAGIAGAPANYTLTDDARRTAADTSSSTTTTTPSPRSPHSSREVRDAYLEPAVGVTINAAIAWTYRDTPTQAGIRTA
jgi:hypothetical protein